MAHGALELVLGQVAPQQQTSLGKKRIIHVNDGYSAATISLRVLVRPLAAERFNAFVAPASIRIVGGFVLSDFRQGRHIWGR